VQLPISWNVTSAPEKTINEKEADFFFFFFFFFSSHKPEIVQTPVTEMDRGRPDETLAEAVYDALYTVDEGVERAVIV
jgi:hypothetical protein